MTLLGRVETIGWLGEPRLRVYPLEGKPFNTGAFSLIPWRLRRRRRFDPFKA
ncbi:hypothetical protein [Aquipuribacter sp. SD81]|uniref:hypothetical protein n=1 Tax=Aquipuribacter sp. SD81 TaxID=3127703 RepID=UPI00301960DD